MADMSHIPMAANPNGAPPNFVNPPSLELTLLGVGVAFIVLSGSALAIRLFTNYKHTGRLGLDDYLCLFGEIGISTEGAARHIWDVPVTIVTKSFIKRQFSLQMIIAPTMWATKAAVLALYIRIFSSLRWMRFTCYSLIVVLFLFYGSNIVIAAIYCLPRKGAPWDATAFERCSSTAVSAVVIGVFAVVADLVIIILPLPTIFGLRLAPDKRLGITIVFMIGFLTVLTSVVSLAYKVKVFLGNDPTWNGVNVTLATLAEIFGSVIVSCAPALYSFWLNFAKKSQIYSNIRSTFMRTGNQDYSPSKFTPIRRSKNPHHGPIAKVYGSPSAEWELSESRTRVNRQGLE
ncbi:hypothetical protein FQN57_000550 [Myotisia sp. PD_48]|nr:hypothetical protein FQN57_000550 [Myotisia sp. PD_48]